MAPIYIDGGNNEVKRIETFETILLKLRDDIAAESYFKPEHRLLKLSRGQRGGLLGLFNQYLSDHKDDRDRRMGILEFILEKGVASTNDLTKWQASCIINLIKVPSQEGSKDRWELSKRGYKLFRCCEKAAKGIDKSATVFQPEWDTEPAVESDDPGAPLPYLPESDLVTREWKFRP